jgi:hypothetical protein
MNEETIDPSPLKRASLTTTEIARIVRLRMAYTPAQIAEIVHRSKCSIVTVLSLEKKKTGIIYPKLRHGNLKYDKERAAQLRQMIKMGMKYREIKQKEGLHISQISRILAADARGELRW